MLDETYDLLLATSSVSLPAQSLSTPDTPIAQSAKTGEHRKNILLVTLATLMLGGSIFAGIIIIIRDKDGKERRIEVPAGASVTVVDDTNTPTVPKPTVPKPAAPNDEPPSPIATSIDITRADVGDIPQLFPVKELETDESVFKVFFHPRHNSCFAFQGREVKEVDLDTGELKKVISIRQGVFKFSPQGNYLIKSSGIGASRTLAYLPIRQIGEKPQPESKGTKFKEVNITALLSPDGVHSASRSEAKGWCIYTVLPERQLTTLEGGENVTAHAFSPDGSFLVGLSEQAIHIWEVPSGKLVQTWEFEIKDAKQQIRFLSNDRLVTTLGREFVIVEKGEVVRRWKPHDKPFQWDTSLQDGRIVSWRIGEAPVVWNAQGEAIAKLKGKHENEIGWLDIHPNGKKAIAVKNGEIDVWNLP